MANLNDHEARIAALEASQTDYRGLLAVANALGATQREHSLALADLKRDVADVKRDVTDMKHGLSVLRAHARSTDEHLAEIRDLIIDLRDR